MKITKKLMVLSFFGLLLIGSFSIIPLALAQGSDETQVNQNKYQGSIAGNETHQFRFRNKFQFQIKTNASIDMDIDVDVDEVGERSFQLELNTTEQVRLQVRVNASDESIGLGQGAQVQTRNQNRYRYQEQFRVNLTCNGTVEAKIGIKTENGEGKTWAYFDEEHEDWVSVKSSYQNGVLTAETNHFSVWTVLTLEEDSSTNIPGYSLIGLMMITSIIGLLVYIKKRK